MIELNSYPDEVAHKWKQERDAFEIQLAATEKREREAIADCIDLSAQLAAVKAREARVLHQLEDHREFVDTDLFDTWAEFADSLRMCLVAESDGGEALAAIRHVMRAIQAHLTHPNSPITTMDLAVDLGKLREMFGDE